MELNLNIRLALKRFFFTLQLDFLKGNSFWPLLAGSNSTLCILLIVAITELTNVNDVGLDVIEFKRKCKIYYYTMV